MILEAQDLFQRVILEENKNIRLMQQQSNGRLDLKMDHRLVKTLKEVALDLLILK